MLNQILYQGVNIPPATEHYMDRSKINNLFKSAIEKPLVAVIAGAGFGKTQSVANFLNQNKEALYVSWFSINDLDNVVERYAERFVYASGSRNEGLSDQLKLLEIPYTEDTYKKYAEILTNPLFHSTKRLLVLDDYHFIHNPEILIFLENHVLLNIPNFTVIIIARKRPSFNLEMLISKGLATAITEKDLKLSKAEITEYFQLLGWVERLNIVECLYQYTQGWVFAVNRAGILLENTTLSDEDFIKTLKIETFNFIEDEMFFSLSEGLKLLLIKLSFFDDMPAGLVKSIALSQDLLLEMEEKIGFFISYNQLLECYEITGIFKDFLAEKQSGVSADEISVLYSFAGDWFAQNNRPIDAIKSYQQAGRFDALFDILIGYKDFCTLETATIFIEIIENTPEEYIQSRPIISVVQGRHLIHILQFAKAEAILNETRKHYESLPQSKQNNAVLGETYIMLGWISMLTRTYDFIELFIKADACLPEGSVLVDNQTQIVPGNNIRFNNDNGQEEIQTFESAYFQAMPYAQRVMNGWGYGLDFLVAAEAAYFLNNFKKAEKDALEAISRSKEQNQFGIENTANFILIRIQLAKGNYAGCAEILSTIKNQIDITQPHFNYLQYDIIEGWFYNMIDQPSKIADWILEEHRLNISSVPILVHERNILLARCFLAQGRYYELLAFLDKVEGEYQDRSLVMVNIHLPIIKAIALYYIGDKEDACTALEEACRLSMFSNITMPFIEYGTKMRTLLHFIKQNPNSAIPTDWLDSIYSKASSYAKQIAKVTHQYKLANQIEGKKTTELTNREMEVLSHLCNGLTRRQIAVSCDLSINTVKTMLQNIYSKLGASNKKEAIYFAALLNYKL